MTRILVVENESRYVERIRDALVADGWTVEAVPGRDAALDAAAAAAPTLVLVNVDLAGAADLVARFGRTAGGCGVVALVPEAGTGSAETLAGRADGRLDKPFADHQVRLLVKRCATEPRQQPAAAKPAVPAGPKLTSREIFGDLLAEFGGEPEVTPSSGSRPGASAPEASAPEASAPSASASEVAAPSVSPPSRPQKAPASASPRAADPEIERRLEETLSGVLAGSRKAAPKAAAPSPAPPPATEAPPPSPARSPKREASQAAEDEVESLLSRTLSDLEIGRPRPARPRPEPEPSPLAAPPVGEPAPVQPAAPVPSTTPVQPPVPAAETPAEPAPQAPPATPAPPAPEPPASSPLATQRIPAVGREEGDGQFGQYTLLDKIAVGGMAEVWKARMQGMEGFQKTVAIKKILPHLTHNSAFVSMFIDEAKLAAQLSHPNITHIYDLGKIGDDYYIAMEYVEGKNLRALLNTSRRRGLKVPLGLALLTASRLASALDYAHRKRDFDDRELGLVHRDVSPQNVLISYEGDIKLCDFGIVKAVTKVGHTQMGALKGKIQYMSPEQAWGRSVDARSDVFSLGSLTFELLAGRRLFPGDTEISVLDQVRECRVESPRDLDPTIPEEVDAIVRKALSKAPEDRYQTAGAMQQELEAVLYSLRPTPSQADLASFMYELFLGGESREGAGEEGEEGTPEPAAAAPGAVSPGSAPALESLPALESPPALPALSELLSEAGEEPEVELVIEEPDLPLPPELPVPEAEDGPTAGEGTPAAPLPAADEPIRPPAGLEMSELEMPELEDEPAPAPEPAAITTPATSAPAAGEPIRPPAEPAPAPEPAVTTTPAIPEPAPTEATPTPAPTSPRAREPSGAEVAAVPPAAARVEIEEGVGRGKGWLIAVVLLLVAVGAAAGWYYWSHLREPGVGGAEEGVEETVPVEPAEGDAGGEAAGTPPLGAVGSAAPEGELADGEAGQGTGPVADQGGAVAPRAAAPSPAQTEPINVEEMVDEELARRQEALRQQLEEEQRRLQEEVAAAQAAAEEKRRQEEEAARARREEEARARQEAEERARTETARRQAAEEARQAPPSPPAAEPPEERARPGGSQPAEPQAETPEEKAPAVKVGQLVGPGPGVVPPELVSIAKPEYPPVARRLRIEGEVELELLVDERGNVAEVRVVKPVPQDVGLNEAATTAARTAKFKPATKDGIRVKFWTKLKIPFKL